MNKFIILFFLYFNIVLSQGAWIFSNRTHGELVWKTIKTENFNIHFHEEIYEIAVKGANIAEKIRPIIMKQVGLDSLPKLSIVFTSEDEIANGFANSANYTLIWVDQNDAAIELLDSKWLEHVLAHELQHLAFFNVVKSWLPFPMNFLYSQVPLWFIEGLAEYYTETWRPYRFDISHKYHVLKNKIQSVKDPHNDGFSKLLYFSDRFGDEKLIQILNYRDKQKLFNFKKAFQSATGISIKQFEEDWRRHMNTYYFSIISQKETYKDIGDIYSLPLRYVYGFDFFNYDSTRMLLVGRKNNEQLDLSLFLATRDTLKEKEKYDKLIRKNEDTKNIKIKPIWDLKELDFGRIGYDAKLSPDNKKIVYSKYRYGKNQSLLWDIFLFELETNKKTRITNSLRANNPCWSPDNKKIAFVSHQNSTSNLFTMELKPESEITRLTNYSGDVQIVTPSWSYDGSKIAYALSKEDANMDIVVFDIERKEPIRVTKAKHVDYRPIWHSNGEKITYTSHKESTPNIFTVDINTKKIIQNTNVGGAIWGQGWKYDKSKIVALTLGDADSSRVVEVNTNKISDKVVVQMNPYYSNWRYKTPDHMIPNLDSLPNKYKGIEIKNYSFIKNMKHLGTILLPDVTGLFYNGSFIDVTGRHVFNSFIVSDWSDIYGAFGYLNATGKPMGGFWSIELYKDLMFEERYYNKNNDYLIEFYNGLKIFGYRNYNFGKNISANHNIKYGVNFFNRKVVFSPDSLDIFSNAEPESGREGAISLSYTFTNKRPNITNQYLPKNGYGLKFEIEIINKNFWGDFNYNHYNFDSFINKKLGPFVLYVRSRYEQVSGSPPKQETVGLVDIPSNYYSGMLILGKEHMSPRGWSGANLGDRAFLGTAEIRTLNFNLNFLEILKFIKVGKLSFSLISDIGKTWGENKYDWVTTAGVESRLSVIFGNMPVLIYSVGIAQTIDQWSDNPNAEGIDPYIRLALVNPF